MFTGIIEDVGTVARVGPGAGGGRTLWIRHGFASGSVQVGDSVAHNGVCLTATRLDGDTFSVDAGPETLARTTVGELAAGHRVNLERAVTPATRLGGHLVQGHVDAVGRVRRVVPRENARDLEIEAPEEVLRLAIPRGSIAIDGISLTITGRTRETFSVSIIPHTWTVTTIAGLAAGSRVNLEADLLARYVAGLLEGFAGGAAGGAAGGGGGLTEAFLREHGF